MSSSLKNKLLRFDCLGIDNGFARTSERIVSITDAIDNNIQDLYCPLCLAPVLKVNGNLVRPHFRHFVTESHIASSPESALHKSCKANLLRRLQSKWNDWDDEVYLSEIQSQPDLLGKINGRLLAIEIQKSVISPDEIRLRTEKYQQLQITVLWIVPLERQLTDELIRPRIFERYLHEIYNGRIYYWHDEKPHHIQPVHFGVASRYIPETHFVKDGEEVSFGGYYRDYVYIKKPEFSPQMIDISSLFDVFTIDQNHLLAKIWHYPRSLLYKDQLESWGTMDQIDRLWYKRLKKIDQISVTDEYLDIFYFAFQKGTSIEIPSSKSCNPIAALKQYQKKLQTSESDSVQWCEAISDDAYPDDYWQSDYEIEVGSYKVSGIMFGTFLDALPNFKWLLYSGVSQLVSFIQTKSKSTWYHEDLRLVPYLGISFKKDLSCVSVMIMLKYNNNGNTLRWVPKGYSPAFIE